MGDIIKIICTISKIAKPKYHTDVHYRNKHFNVQYTYQYYLNPYGI